MILTVYAQTEKIFIKDSGVRHRTRTCQDLLRSIEGYFEYIFAYFIVVTENFSLYLSVWYKLLISSTNVQRHTARRILYTRGRQITELTGIKR